MRHIVGMVLAVGLLFVAWAPTEAQVRIAPEVVVGDNVDFGVGGHVFFPVPSVSPQIEVGGFFDIYFPGSFNYWELGGTVYYLFPLEGTASVIPKAGAGVTIGFSSYDSDSPGVDNSSSTNVGLHLLGGVEFPMNKVQPFVEVGAGLGDIPDFFLRAGVGFKVGGGG